MGIKQSITWKKPAAITYGEALSKTQLNATLDKGKGDGDLSYSPKAGERPNAGKVTLRVTASKTKAFDLTTAEVELTVNKAEQTIEWAKPAAITYGTALDAKQLSAKLKQGDGDLVYATKAKTVLDAGTHVLKVSSAATKNYEAAEASVDLVVKKAEQTIDWKAPAAIVYGEALSAKQLSAKLTEGDGDLVYATKAGTVLDAGTHALKVTVAATKNFEAAQATVNLVVKKAEPAIEWKAPAPITYGEALDATQLTAKLSEGDGDLVYATKAKTVLDAGTHELSVTAAATKNFETAQAKVTLVVKKATPVIKWRAPEPITYGAALDGQQLDAELKLGDGELSYTPKAKTVLDAGTHDLQVSVPATKNFEAAQATVSLVVEKAAQVIKWLPPRALTVGDALSATQLNAELTQGDGALVYLPKLGVVAPSAGLYTLKVTASATKNYEQATAEVKIVMQPAPILVSTWMAQLGFANRTNLYIMDLGAHTGQTGKGKPIHLSVFKSNLPTQIAHSTAGDVLDVLFPAKGDNGFHITIDFSVGSSLKNPHVYRGMNEIYKGQGNALSEDEWKNLYKTLSNRLTAELGKLKSAITATKWCKA